MTAHQEGIPISYGPGRLRVVVDAPQRPTSGYNHNVVIASHLTSGEPPDGKKIVINLMAIC